jgi:ABC-type uncharacterized transport system ATPase subunit
MDQTDENTAVSTTVAEPNGQPVTQPQSGTQIFAAENVSIYYSAFKAVTDVSLSIYENEITAFIGPRCCAP